VHAQALVAQFDGDEGAGTQFAGGGEGGAGILADEDARCALGVGLLDEGVGGGEGTAVAGLDDS
jgi:hypothetical protein